MINNKFKRTLITSALPYANGYIHLGHLAGAYLAADIYTRYLRLNNEEVIHVSGSDEHGAPITISAELEGVSPNVIIDRYHFSNEKALRECGIDFDIFGRTSWTEHHKTAQEFFLDFYKKGFFVEKEEQQFYDDFVNKFLPDRYVEGTCPNCNSEGARGDQCDSCSATYNQIELINPISKLSGKTPILKSTKHFYFKLNDFQERLEDYVESHSKDWRKHVLQQTRSWLKQGLGERAMTRDLDWGIDVPIVGYEGKKLYVWFDAPFGYISNTKVYCKNLGNENDWKKWWQSDESRYVAFIGKDNIVFHTLIFPATLMASNEGNNDKYILPNNVPANEFLNLEGKKFSKSKNWGIDLKDFLLEYPPDPLRYMITANMPENKDSDFTWNEFKSRNNNELADIFGNFINRTLQFTFKNFDGKVPKLVENEKESELINIINQDLQHAITTEQDKTAIAEFLYPKYLKYFNEIDINALIELAYSTTLIGSMYNQFRFKDALFETMNLARTANKYFNDSEPWKTLKSDFKVCSVTLNICIQFIKSLSILFEPVIPFTSKKIYKMLNLKLLEKDFNIWKYASEISIQSGHELGALEILFPKFDEEMVVKEISKLGLGSEPIKTEKKIDLKPEIDITEFQKLDLRVAKILSAERVKKSDKLIKLQIEIGDLKKQILAGIGKKYDPEFLIGKKIIVVANLKPTKLMGELSEGMLLAANSLDSSAPPTLITIIEDDNEVLDGFVIK